MAWSSREDFQIRATVILGEEAFDRLVASVPDTQATGRLRYWQKQLLARLAAETQTPDITVEQFVKLFGGCRPQPTATALSPREGFDPAEALALPVGPEVERLELLGDRLRTAPRPYKQIKARCESMAIRWRWASARLHDLRPFHFERGGYRRGRWLKGPPFWGLQVFDSFHYGLDLEDRPVVQRRYPRGSEGRVEETFFVYESDSAESVEYDATGDKELLEVCRLELEEGRPVSGAWSATNQRGFEDYDYRDGQLVGIDATWSIEPYDPKELRVVRYELEYDERAQIERLTATYRTTAGHAGGTYQWFKGRGK